MSSGINCRGDFSACIANRKMNYALFAGRRELARKCLVWLRNTSDIQEELYAIQKASNSTDTSISITGVVFIRDPAVRRPLLCAIFLMANQQLCGINAVVFFTVSIFQSAGTALSASAATVVIGAVMLLATAASALVVNRVGRIPTLLVTQSLMTVALLAFGAFFYLKAGSPPSSAVTSSLGWLPLTALAVFITAFSFGLGPLSWLMLGELLPTRTAGVAGSLASMINWMLGFVVTLTFSYLIEWLGDYGAYWLFAGFCAFGIIGTAKILPETKGKSLREIQNEFLK